MSVRHVFRATCLLTLVWMLVQTFSTLSARVGPAPPPGAMRVMSGVIDQIVDEAWAVVLVGPSEEELLVPAASLPPGARAGTWLILRQGDSGALTFEIDAASSAAALERIERKLHALKARGSSLTSP